MDDLYNTIFQSLDTSHKLLTAVSCNLTDQLQSLIDEGAGMIIRKFPDLRPSVFLYKFGCK